MKRNTLQKRRDVAAAAYTQQTNENEPTASERERPGKGGVCQSGEGQEPQSKEEEAVVGGTEQSARSEEPRAKRKQQTKRNLTDGQAGPKTGWNGGSRRTKEEEEEEKAAKEEGATHRNPTKYRNHKSANSKKKYKNPR